jgi:hypothetical protein
MRWKLPKVLHRLYSIRDDRVYGSRETLVAAVNTVLQSWPEFTEVVVATAAASKVTIVRRGEKYAFPLGSTQSSRPIGVIKISDYLEIILRRLTVLLHSIKLLRSKSSRIDTSCAASLPRRQASAIRACLSEEQAYPIGIAGMHFE